MTYPTDQPVHYMHLRLGNGFVTAAFQTVTEGFTTAYVSLAFCSPKDQFCRRTGRLIASGRLKKHKFFWELTVDPEKNIKKQIQSALWRSQGAERFPSWASYAAPRRLSISDFQPKMSMRLS